MFPLARMVVFDNSFIKSQIKKVQGGALNVFVLMENGDVWVAGSNLNGELGLGQFTGWNGMTPQWTKVLSGVDDIWARGPGSKGLFFLQNGKYKFQGRGNAIGASGTIFTAQDTGLDLIISDNPGCVVRQISMYDNSIHALIRLSDGTDRVYSIGRGYMLGRGTDVNSTVWVESTAITAISTNIIKISNNSNCLYFNSYQGTDASGYDFGLLYGTGKNAMNQLDSDGLSTFIGTPKLLLSQVYDFNAGSDAWVANYQGTQLYGQGYNPSNSISPSTTTTFTTPTSLGLATEFDVTIHTATNSTAVYYPSIKTMRGIGSVTNIDSTGNSPASSKTWITIFNPSTFTRMDNFATGYGTSSWGNNGDWFISKDTPLNGITGIVQTNGSFKLPNFGG